MRKDAKLKGKGSDNSMRSLKSALSPRKTLVCKHWATLSLVGFHRENEKNSLLSKKIKFPQIKKIIQS